MSNKTFQRVGSLRPGRSVFDLSYEKKLTCDMGQLVPIMCDEMVPGDTFILGNQVVIRLMPLVAPIMHEVNCYIHYFFVPYRLLWDSWEDFITGGKTGDVVLTPPTWATSNQTVGSLWDHLGFPTDASLPAEYRPSDFPHLAYVEIFNKYYRDENLQDEYTPSAVSALLYRHWEKDYFTSALPWQQRGTAPALPISGLSSAEWPASAFAADSKAAWLGIDTSTAGDNKMHTTNAVGDANVKAFFANNTVDLSDATTFNVADLRLAFQIQKFLERNARAGARYIEFLGAHFGVHPRDERLQRPEYIGGSKSRIIISEVLQTSSTDATSPQGNLAGHGITADQTFIGKYTAQEFGLVMGIMSIMPKPAYQQGINRQWLRRTKYDYYFPEFANLSEQAIERGELYATSSDSDNRIIFGYQGRYDEMRYKPNMVAGLMRTTFDYWHLGRKFTSAPLLNDTFTKCIPSKRIFADQADPALIVTVGNLIKAIRPMPIQSNPGLIDHN